MTRAITGLTRRSVTSALTIGIAGGLSMAGAKAQTAPTGPVKLVAGFAAGGSSDIVARLVAKYMQEKLGWTVVVENKPGAGGRTAAQEVARSKPDGSTIFISNIVNAVLIPLTFSDAHYHPLKDFTPLARAVDFQIAFATGPMTRATTLKDLLAWLKANPDKAVYGVPGAASIPHLYSMQLAKAAGLDMRMLQMRGGGPVATELLGGNIPLGVAGTGDFAELHRDKKIQIVAVSGSARAPGFDEVATFKEQGFEGFESNGWIAFFAPPKMAGDLQKVFSDAIIAALREPTTVAQLKALGFVANAGGPADLTAQIERDIAKWTPLVEASGVKR